MTEQSAQSESHRTPPETPEDTVELEAQVDALLAQIEEQMPELLHADSAQPDADADPSDQNSSQTHSAQQDPHVEHVGAASATEAPDTPTPSDDAKQVAEAEAVASDVESANETDKSPDHEQAASAPADDLSKIDDEASGHPGDAVSEANDGDDDELAQQIQALLDEAQAEAEGRSAHESGASQADQPTDHTADHTADQTVDHQAVQAEQPPAAAEARAPSDVDHDDTAEPVSDSTAAGEAVQADEREAAGIPKPEPSQQVAGGAEVAEVAEVADNTEQVPATSVNAQSVTPQDATDNDTNEDDDSLAGDFETPEAIVDTDAAVNSSEANLSEASSDTADTSEHPAAVADEPAQPAPAEASDAPTVVQASASDREGMPADPPAGKDAQEVAAEASESKNLEVGSNEDDENDADDEDDPNLISRIDDMLAEQADEALAGDYESVNDILDEDAVESTSPAATSPTGAEVAAQKSHMALLMRPPLPMRKVVPPLLMIQPDPMHSRPARGRSRKRIINRWMLVKMAAMQAPMPVM